MKKKILPLLAAALLLCGCTKEPAGAAPTEPSASSTPDVFDSKTIYICTSQTRTVDGSTTRTDYILDEQNQVKEVQVFTNDALTMCYDVECDSNGNYIRWISDSMTIEYSYDEAGHPLGKTMFSGGTLISSTEYTWENGNQTALTNRNGPQEQRTLYLYNEDGQKVREEFYQNSVLVNYSHLTLGEDGRPVTQEVYLADGTLYSTVNYAYEGTDCTATTTLTDGTLDGSTQYQYDDNGNLIRTTVLDKDGNVLSETTETWIPIEVAPDSLRASI
ncbi:MAG: hypothetical protein IJB11_01845 [Oscillospiraceae bacterium]|nr:hypothetical protein [Oscillospiraceae bacterium]